jgi:two-component system chemotaxis response regulator CheY
MGIVTMNLKILAIDDSNTIIKVYKSILPKIFKNNLSLVVAHDGHEAFEQLEKHPNVELIFCDINMPKMKGDEFVKRLRSIVAYNHIRVIMVTTEGGRETIKKMGAAGANGYVIKPFTEDKIRKVLKPIISRIPHIQMTDYVYRERKPVKQKPFKIVLADDSADSIEYIKSQVPPLVNRETTYIEVSCASEILPTLRMNVDAEILFVDIDISNPNKDNILAGIKRNPLYKNLKVIVTSTDPDLAMKKSVIDQGAVALLVKPFHDDEVKNLFDTLDIEYKAKV